MKYNRSRSGVIALIVALATFSLSVPASGLAGTAGKRATSVSATKSVATVAPKPNTPCKIAKQKSGSLVCTNVKGKLVWRLGPKLTPTVQKLVIPPTTIALTSQPNDSGFTAWLANDLGYFQANNLTVSIKYAASGAAALAAGAAGDWQAGWTGGPPALTGANTFGLLIAGPMMDESGNNVLIMRTDALKGRSVADVLREDKLAAPANSVGSYVLIGCAIANGVDPLKLNVVSLDPPSVLNALQSGQVSGGTSFSSNNYALLQQPDKYKVVCAGGQPGTGTSSYLPLILTQAFAKASPEAAAGFLEAMFRAGQYVEANRSDAIQRMQRFYDSIGALRGMDKASFALDQRNYYSLDEAIKVIEDGTLQKALTDMANYFLRVGTLTKMPDLKQNLSDSLVILKLAKRIQH